MTKIGFNGVPQSDYLTSDDIHEIVDFSVESFDLGETRAASKGQYYDIGDDDVIEFEYEDGIIDFLTKEDLQQRKNDKATRGIEPAIDPDSDDEVVWIANSISIDSADRGIKDLLVKSLRIFKIKDKPAQLAVDVIAKKVDNKNVPRAKNGLFYCNKEAVTLDRRFSKSSTDTKEAYLLLIHGFASTIEQSFGGLSQSDGGETWKVLWKKYPGRLIAFNHQSITKSPLENAADLIDGLAKEMTIDLLSFSRGGLVAEIITKAAEVDSDSEEGKAFWEAFRACFENREQELKQIDRIIKGIKLKKPKIRNYVRTACPAGGTTLGSDRLVLYLKLFLNGIGMIPQVKVFPPYNYLKGFIIAVAKQKDNIKLVPGIEALNPDSALIKGITNLGGVFPITKTPLHVISGDTMFGKFTHTLKVIAADAFFLGKNDFIVDTLSMFQGFVRQSEVNGESHDGFYYSYHRTSTVSHFSYFIEKDSRKAIVTALQNSAAESPLFNHYSTNEDLKQFGIRGVQYDHNKPTVIVIPGIMGSHLEVNNDRIWLDFKDLVFGGMKKLEISAENVKANGAIGMFYDDVSQYLSKSHNVVVHGFDWRKDLMEEVSDLKALVEFEIERSEKDKPVKIVAHSMGGLLVQALYAMHRDTWKMLKERNGFKTLFFGTPFGGSHTIINIYLKKHSFYNMLHRLDIRNDSDEILAIINDYVGVLQLLPTETSSTDFFSQFTWQGLQQASGKPDEFIIPSEESLGKAKKWKELIDQNPIEGEELVYIAGKDDLTPIRVDYNSTLQVIKVMGTVDGDGAVPWATGITDAFSTDRTYYLNTKHQYLLKNKASFSGIVDLLFHNTTNNPEFKSRPSGVRGVQKEFEMPEVRYLAVNNTSDLEKMLAGDKKSKFSNVEENTTQVDIKVTHGDLGYADYPVVVGHFEGDKLLGAEWAINKHLKGKLQENLDLGTYPGKLRESLVVLDGGGLFKGTLVIGLGYNERLTEKELERTCTKGLLEMALQESRYASSQLNDSSDFGISFLLVGSSYGGLDAYFSLRATVKSVLRANKILRESKIQNIRTFNKIEIIELYEEKAIQINRSLIQLKADVEFKNDINISEIVEQGTAGLVRVADEQKSDWWHRLQITEEEKYDHRSKDAPVDKFNQVMKFASLSDKARAEVEMVLTNKQLINTLVSKAVKELSRNSLLSKTLYELLIPNEFKGYSDDLRNIKLIVDESTAAYPWEILNYANIDGEDPVITQTGFIRQLYDPYYRANSFYTRENNALIISDPIPSAPYRPLPFAKKEGMLVRDLINDHEEFNVEYSENEDGLNVVSKFFKKHYKVIHIAGHGEYDANHNDNSGLILSDGIRFTPKEIYKMSSVPELVFINCCHLGGVDPGAEDLEMADRNKLAANFGTQFIRNGVKAVVAAGWAVDDKAAMDFAEVFYKHMFKGDDFGTAVRYARKYCYTENEHSNTWGAYQCYGNPHYRLTDGKGTQTDEIDHYVHKKEIIIKLENIARRADALSSRKLKDDIVNTRQKVDKILFDLRDFWKDDYSIMEAAGWAYFELNYFEKSRAIYEVAYDNDPLEMSNLSRLNYLVALTMCLIDNPNDYSAEERERFISRADDIARFILDVSDHPETFSVVAGHEKRKLSLIKDDAFQDTIENCVRHYYSALTIATKSGKGDVMYSLSNFLFMNELYRLYSSESLKLAQGRGRSHKVINSKKLLKQGVSQLEDLMHNSPDFWSTIHEADLIMVELFINSDKLKPMEMNDMAQKSLNIIKSTWSRGGSWRKLTSIKNHYLALKRIVDKTIINREGTEGETQIRHLQEALVSLLNGLVTIEDIKD